MEPIGPSYIQRELEKETLRKRKNPVCAQISSLGPELISSTPAPSSSTIPIKKSKLEKSSFSDRILAHFFPISDANAVSENDFIERPHDVDNEDEQEDEEESFQYYSKIQLLDELSESMNEFEMPTYARVNERYPNIKCVADSIVPINYGDGKIYPLHANTCKVEGVDRSIIATQAPLEEEFGFFWVMAATREASDGTNIILDLTNKEDIAICWPRETYYPKNNEIKVFTHTDLTIQVKHLRNKEKGSFSIGYYHVTSSNPKIDAVVKRLHFSTWPDFGTVAYDELDEMINVIMSPKIGRCTVHCKAGVGRTGTIIAAALIKKALEESKLTFKDENDKVEFEVFIRHCVLELREQRGKNFVQTDEQYDFLHRFLFDHFFASWRS